MTLPVLLSFVVLVMLCAMALVWSSWPRWIKGLLVLSVSVFYFYAHQVLHGVVGWPATDPLPARWVLLAAVIDEPSSKSKGALYVWVHEIRDGKPVPQPRSFQLPYSKDLHSLLNEGMKKTRQGVSQMGTAEPKKGPGGFSWLRPGGEEQEVKIRDLPAPQLPEK